MTTIGTQTPSDFRVDLCKVMRWFRGPEPAARTSDANIDASAAASPLNSGPGPEEEKGESHSSRGASFRDCVVWAHELLTAASKSSTSRRTIAAPGETVL